MYQTLCYAARAALMSNAVVILNRNGVRALGLFHRLLACRCRLAYMCWPTSRSRPDAGSCQPVQRFASRFAIRARALSLSGSNATAPFPGATLQ